MPMKRTSIVFATFMLLCSITAGAWMHNTPCGKAVQTVSPDFFETEEEALEFYDELNRIYCGEGTLPDKEKQPDKPLPAIP